MKTKKSFFERLTGNIRLEDEEEEEIVDTKKQPLSSSMNLRNSTSAIIKDEPEEEEEGELSVDVYQTPSEIIVQTMVAGVHPDNLSITITRDMIIVKGKREEVRNIHEDNYYMKELYWGTFSRTISLPEEVDPEEAEAMEKHGLLVIKLPKINKDKKTVLKVKSV